MNKHTKKLFDKCYKYSIRRLTIGTVSVVVGTLLFGSQTVLASSEQVNVTESTVISNDSSKVQLVRTSLEIETREREAVVTNREINLSEKLTDEQATVIEESKKTESHQHEVRSILGTDRALNSVSTDIERNREIVLENTSYKRKFKIEDGVLKTVSLTNKINGNETLTFAEDSKEFTVQFKPTESTNMGNLMAEEVFRPESMDRHSWKVTSSSNENGTDEGPNELVVDNNPNTLWHSRYNANGVGTIKSLPVDITFEFPKAKNIKSLVYLPRQNGENGDIKDYKIYVKKEKGDFSNIKSGTLPRFSDRRSKFIDLGEQSGIKALKLQVLSSQNGQNFASAAEFDVSNKTVAQLQSEVSKREQIRETELSQYSISLNQLKVKRGGVEITAVEGGKRYTFTFLPYNFRNVPLEIKYIVDLKDEASFSQSHLAIKVPKEKAAVLTIDRIDLQSYKLKGNETVLDFAHQDGIAEMGGFKGFYAGLGQPVYINSFFTGSEFPVARNAVDNNLLTSRYHSGKDLGQLPKDEQGYYHTWNTVVGVARSKDYQVIQQDFYKYLSEIGQKTYYRKQYNSWFDHMKNITAENISSSFEQVDRGFTLGGVSPLDSYVVDDGWQTVPSLWEFNSKFPNKLYDSSRQTGRFGSNFGLWLGPQGGYGNPGAMADALVQQGKGSRHAGVVYIGDKRYVDGLHERFKEYDQKFDINYWKLDGLLLNPKATSDQYGIGGGYENMYSMTETHERWISLYETIRKNATNPDKMWINLTSYIPPSPWFLQWVNSIWMQNSADVDYQDGVKKQEYAHIDFGSDANEALTYRDDRYEELVNKRKWQLPFANIYNHDPVYGATAHSSKRQSPNGVARQPINFTTDELRTYLYMLGTRGTGFWEFYYSPSMMDDDKWAVNGEAVNWIESNYETLKNARFHGGKPGYGEVYGYSAWDSEKGIVSVRNPSNIEKSYTLTLDRLVGMPENISGLYRKIVLGDSRHNTTQTTRYKDALTLRLKPYETVIFEYSKQDDTTPATLLQARAVEDKKIQLTFDEKIDITNADFGVSGKNIASKTLGADLRTVTLILNEKLTNRETVQVSYAKVKDSSARANLSKGKVSLTAYEKGRILDIADVDAHHVLKDTGITGKGSFSVTIKANLATLNQTLAQQGKQWKLSVDKDGRVAFNVKGLEVKSAPYRQLNAEDRGTPDELVTAGEEVLITAMRQENGSLRLYVNGTIHNTAYDKTKVNENLVSEDLTIGGTSFQGSISRFILENNAKDFCQVKVLESELASKSNVVALPVVNVVVTSYDTNDNGPKPAANVNDRNVNTYWASDPNQDNTRTRQTLTLELAESKEVSVVVYTPRPVANAVGNVKKLYLETSVDGQRWNRATILEGNADNTKSLNAADVQPQGIMINPVKAKYVRLTALETAHWHPYLENKVVAATALTAYHVKHANNCLPNVNAYLRNMLEQIIVNEISAKTRLVLAPVVNVAATSYDVADNGPKPAKNVNDGNTDTYWVSDPRQANTQTRQTLTLELAENKNISVVMYTPRSVADAVGNVKKLYLETSVDGRNWIRATILGGNADNTKTLNAANLQPQSIAIMPVAAKYVRLTALETAHWNQYEVNKVVAAVAFTAYYEYKSVTPEQPKQPMKPVEPTKPVTPEQPKPPVKPVEPAKPVTPEQPKPPVKPAQPAEPDKPLRDSQSHNRRYNRLSKRNRPLQLNRNHR